MTPSFPSIDPKRLGRVAVLFGGTSAEREVSLNSGRAVLQALQNQQVEAIGFDTAERPLIELLEDGVDHALIMLHGRGGEDGTIQGALSQLGITYTGSNVLGSALAMDKVRSKQIWQQLGLPTAQYAFVQRGQNYNAENLLSSLGGEVMVKPAQEGSSIGMARVSDASAMARAIEAALQFDETVLLETFITGPEYTVGILGEVALPSIHMATPNAFYDYQAKYQSTQTQYHCPSGLDESDEADLADLAKQAFKALGCSGWGRVDFMRDAKGNWYLLEANTVPGMTETSLVPKAAKQAGLSFDNLVMQIAAQGVGGA